MSEWKLMGQFLEGKYSNGQKFLVQLEPDFANEVVKFIAEKYLGKKIKEAKIVLRGIPDAK